MMWDDEPEDFVDMFLDDIGQMLYFAVEYFWYVLIAVIGGALLMASGLPVLFKALSS